MTLRAESCVKYDVVRALGQHDGGPKGVDENPRTLLCAVTLVL
jgi:hypothetical protein